MSRICLKGQGQEGSSKMGSKELFFQRYADLGESPRDVRVHQTIRVNTLKTTHQLLKDRLERNNFKLERIPWLQDGFAVKKSKQSIGSTTEYLLGHYYTQEAAAQLPVHVLDPKPGDMILDMTAAPGGKTTQMSQLMQNKGTIIALDLSNRLYSLKNNIERMGASNVMVYKKDARFVTDFKLQFDKILLDAPCSGNFVGDREWFEKRTFDDMKVRARLQKELIKAAAKVLKPGGILIYSTCSLEPEENEEVIDFILKKDNSLSLALIDLPIGDHGLPKAFGQSFHPDMAKCRRLWPWKSQTQGFFIAKVTKQ
ncbi:RsmB/NOP family class I SAM-dependent RNA methyltransferase [Candidatus Woesearchaeota archaeon]|nr:RsmB/NOP family class I SAM-dependent RNA methyltransferase [Candidatus Woesearchaeota archaeon]